MTDPAEAAAHYAGLDVGLDDERRSDALTPVDDFSGALPEGLRSSESAITFGPCDLRITCLCGCSRPPFIRTRSTQELRYTGFQYEMLNDPASLRPHLRGDRIKIHGLAGRYVFGIPLLTFDQNIRRFITNPDNNGAHLAIRDTLDGKVYVR